MDSLQKLCCLEEEKKRTKPEGEIGANIKEERQRKKKKKR